MNVTLLVVLVVVNAPLYWVLGKLFFGSWEVFWECVKFWFKPDILSWFDGTYWEDHEAEWRLFLWMLLCGLVVFGEYVLISRLFLSG